MCDVHLNLVCIFGSKGEADRIFTNAHSWRADLSSCIPMMGNKTILPPNWKLYHVILFPTSLAFQHRSGMSTFARLWLHRSCSNFSCPPSVNHSTVKRVVPGRPPCSPSTRTHTLLDSLTHRASTGIRSTTTLPTTQCSGIHPWCCWRALFQK